MFSQNQGMIHVSSKTAKKLPTTIGFHICQFRSFSSASRLTQSATAHPRHENQPHSGDFEPVQVEAGDYNRVRIVVAPLAVQEVFRVLGDVGGARRLRRDAEHKRSQQQNQNQTARLHQIQHLSCGHGLNTD